MEENKRIEAELKSIDQNKNLSDEERRIKKIEILKQASKAALDTQIVAHAADTEYVRIISDLQERKYLNNDTFYHKHSVKENTELKQHAIEELQTIKPIIPPLP